MTLRKTLRDLAPPLAWNAYRRIRHGNAVKYANRRYHVVQTDYPAIPLHVGRYADIFECAADLDQHFNRELTRYRVYNVCHAANLALSATGDFLCVGVSFGVSAKTVFEFTNFHETERTYHFLDPFNPADAGGVFNTDATLVMRQYPQDAKVQFHHDYAPAGIPDIPMAFAHFNTGNVEAECASVPIIFDRLESGGIAIFDAVGVTPSYFEEYSTAFKSIDAEPFWFPSGQAMIVKN